MSSTGTQRISSSSARGKPRQITDRARSRPASTASSFGVSRPQHSGSEKGGAKTGKNVGEALKVKEERYRRLNEELEAKTATLVQEAEELMRENLSFMSEDSIAVSSGEEEEAVLGAATDTSSSTQLRTDRTKHATEPSPSCKQRDRQRRKVKGEHQTVIEKGGVGEERSKEKGRDLQSSLTDDIERTVRELEEKLARENITVAHEEEEQRNRSFHLRMDDVVPEVAEEMGTEALMRFMKAKLRVLQEEVDRLSAENITKDKQLSTAEASLKEFTEENIKLKQNHHSMQVQLTRYKQLSADMQHKTEGLEAQLISLRREIDSMKAAHRKAASGHSAVEVRLNRATEEVEKYKTELRKARMDSKEVSKQERQRLEELVGENKRLENQKSELMAAFKKQMKLIDILKRQKLHVEAARMLSFTEEEFIRSLNWDTS